MQEKSVILAFPTILLILLILSSLTILTREKRQDKVSGSQFLVYNQDS